MTAMLSSPPASPAVTQILCRQCGAVLPVEQGSQLVLCDFCGASNALDKSQAVLHYVVRPTIRDDAAEAALRRWMAGNQTVKDLDKKCQIEPPEYQLFPMWLVRANQDGQERVLLEPAAALSVSELKRLALPAADLEPFAAEGDSAAIAPTVPYDAMLRWLADDHRVQPASIRESSIVHLPIYLFKYTYNGRRYTALVDAASSQVFANLFPSKWETPYRAIGAAGCLAYFLAALIPLVGFTQAEGLGLGLGLLAYLVASVVIAVPLFAAAAYVSAKV
jgi:hypothetical protein